MNTFSKHGTLASACLLALMSSGAAFAHESKPMKRGDMALHMMSADSTIASWPKTPKDVAMKMIAKYGQPNEVTPTMLMWHDNGPWKHTMVFKQEVKHDFPGPHIDVLQQVINYKVPLDKYDDLAMYDGSVVVERTNGVISARCDLEEANFLALNLANDVATGKRSVAQARKFYAETIMAFKKGGKPAYTQALQFRVPTTRTADADKPAMMMKP
ncbi:MAG TPA: hypothetical protein VNI56_04280 [Xanthomonadaceae bacterium]|nr:hypothetical protein [Xanthomonadaceae bacterium]